MAEEVVDGPSLAPVLDGSSQPAAADLHPPRPPIDFAAAFARATWVDAVCLGGIVVSVVFGLCTYPLAATLLRHDVVHLFVTGSVAALLKAGADVFGHRMPLWLVFVGATVGLIKFDPFYFWAGRRYGDDVAHFLTTAGSVSPRTVARVEGWVARFGPSLLTASYFVPFLPTTLVMVLLGASRVRWIWFVLADLIGIWLWIAAFAAVGHHFHTDVNHVATLVGHYTLWATVAGFVVIFAVVYVRIARRPTT